MQLTDYDLANLNYESIEYLILPGVDANSSKQAKEISMQLPVPAYWAAGLHPHDAKNLSSQKEELSRLIGEADLIGETGLDYYRDHSSREQQHENLIFHLEMAKDLQKPLIVHCRDSFKILLIYYQIMKVSFQSYFILGLVVISGLKNLLSLVYIFPFQGY